MTLPQLPLLDDILSRGVDAIIEARPSAAKHTVLGEYGKILAGWRAQLALVLAYVSSEIRASRLPLATGQPLLQLLASEFLATIVPGPTAALGEVTLSRFQIDSTASGAATFTPGVIKKGTRFVKRANPTASPAIAASEYESIEPVYCGSAASFTSSGPPYTHRQSVVVRLRAKRSGEAGNGVVFWNNPSGTSLISISDTLFDSTTTTVGYTRWRLDGGQAGGGLDAQSDEELRSLGQALATGQFAPTVSAALAGALNENGVVHAVAQKDLEQAIQNVFIADRSWAWSLSLQDRATQAIRDAWQGFGCRVALAPIQNFLVGISCSIVLTDPKYAADTFDIRESVRKAIRSYFDERPDFYVWRNQAIRAVIAHSDPRILTCDAATVLDGYSGAALSEPSGGTRFHYYLADSGVTLSIASPS